MEEILLDPNLIYLALVAGFMFAFMALLTPGTGVFEILALVSLIFAGYGIINSTVNYWALILILAAAVFFILAIRKQGQRIYLGTFHPHPLDRLVIPVSQRRVVAAIRKSLPGPDHLGSIRRFPLGCDHQSDGGQGDSPITRS